MDQNSYLKKAGHFLMLIHWIESISRLLIILKKDIGLLRRLQLSNNPKEIVLEVWAANREWNYENMLVEFSNQYPGYKDAIILLEDFWLARDVLSHPQMSPDGTFFCVLNKGSRSNKKKQKIIRRQIGRDLAQDEALRVSVSDDNIAEAKKFDTLYFPNICKEISIYYEKIRWPYDEKS